MTTRDPVLDHAAELSQRRRANAIQGIKGILDMADDAAAETGIDFREALTASLIYAVKDVTRAINKAASAR
ncbi:MAG: hypothetical protein GEU93_11175 [Propionibacteriales bacterium]|nr:hypothetical protein [Propionibacteriales bacterium]